MSHTVVDCKVQSAHQGFWDYISPEHANLELIDEKADIWPIGANIFALLTGLFPFYEVWETNVVMHLAGGGQKPYIDPRYKTRSFIEGRLVEIMERCFEYEPENRASIFEVVAFLRDTKRIMEERKRSGNVDWIVDPAGILPSGSDFPIKKFRAHIPDKTPKDVGFGRYQEYLDLHPAEEYIDDEEQHEEDYPSEDGEAIESNDDELEDEYNDHHAHNIGFVSV